MKLVKHILKHKGSEVWSVDPGSSVYDAVDFMAEKGVGALLVMEGSRLVGIISERDYARQIILKGRASESTKVSEIMTTDMVTAGPEQDVGECMVLMTDRRVRHLPILEETRVIGVISIGDLVNAIIAEQQSTIKDLEKYISGG
jgi:CBS domain-containing protein